MYIHQRQNWPYFTWNDAVITTLLSDVRYAQGRLLGQMEALGFSHRQQASWATLTQDVRLFDGFEGKFTSSQWAKLVKCSQDSANRDISDLIKRQVLVKDEAGGRSTRYSLIEGAEPTKS
jgi:Fic family protein